MDGNSGEDFKFLGYVHKTFSFMYKITFDYSSTVSNSKRDKKETLKGQTHGEDWFSRAEWRENGFFNHF